MSDDFNQFTKEASEKLLSILNEAKAKVLDTAGDGAEILVQKLDDALESVQKVLRETKKNIDEKTETDKSE